MSYIIAYPITSPTATVTLPNANLGNVDRLDTNAVVRPTRHGIYKHVRDADWPDLETKLIAFSPLTATEKDNLITFLTTYRGLEIKITDHNSDSFSGVIISDDIEVITFRDGCSYEVTFEFLGETV